MIEICQDTATNFDAATSREWLETNGIGGYASSTVSGAHTRRYHGLLVAATQPPLGRMVLLSKVEKTLIVDGKRFALSSNRYPGAIHPEGYRYIHTFSLDPFPKWQYIAGGVSVEQIVFMAHGENTTLTRWRVLDPGKAAEVRLEVCPLIAFRDHHHLRHKRDGFDESYEIGEGVVSMRPVADILPLYLAHNARAIAHAGHWYRDLEYSIELERGFDYHEDLFQPLTLEFELAEDAVMIASSEARRAGDAPILENAERQRRAALIARSQADDTSLWPLILAADQFIVQRGSGHTVIAGYHWFSDWGRDTMIALPGLTLTTGRPQIAKSILIEFSKHLSEGMLPNRFPDAGEEPDYNTVDATLWYFEAIRAYLDSTDDVQFIQDGIFDALMGIIDRHVTGTRFGIQVDSDGLLMAGSPATQLTWMDAKVDGHAVTPRPGKPVEIQALWYNALCIMADLAARLRDKRAYRRYRSMAEQAAESFRSLFWNENEDCLYDVANEADRDASVRPNQIFAVSLHYTMLTATDARKVVGKVESELLTPVGLRSLSPRDPRYVGRYEGPPAVRDAAYHQGTVWSWLAGPFVEAFRKTHSNDPRAASRIAQILAPLRSHLIEATLGQVSEIFDGDPPHAPRGAAAQAWSVAELLRSLH